MKKLLITPILLLIWLSLSAQKTNGEKASPLNNPQTTKTSPNPKAYCSSIYTNTTDDWITNVTFHTINNTTGQDGANSYGDYDTVSTGLLAGNTYTISVSFFSSGYTQHVWAWFDWNGDDDFLDTGEAYDLGDGNDATLTTSILVPMTASVGYTMMRIIEQYSTDPTPCDPHGTEYGETEDYSIYVSNNNYCSALGGCDEYIYQVQVPGVYTIVSGCDGYMDHSDFNLCNIPLNSSETIDIYIGNPYSADQCGVWVDWNNDDDFYDVNEIISVTGIPDIGIYSATIVPPPGTTLGNYHMRIRIMFTGTLDPCGTTTYGEVEDYSFTVTPEIPATWTGAVDNNWHNADNWNINTIPDATTDVTIADVTNKCWVWAGSAFCNNITVEYGSGYDLRIWDQFFRVYGDFDMYGQLLMDHDDGWILTEGNFTWHSGSTASIQANSLIQVLGDWTFLSGANVHLDDGAVSFEGSGNNNIHSHDQNCYFNLLSIFKTGGGSVKLSLSSTADLHIHDDLTIMLGSTFDIFSHESIFLQGDLMNFGTIEGSTIGTLVFNGDDQAIFSGSTASTLLGSTTINSSNKTEIISDGISVMGVLTIQSGQFVTNDFTIWMMGNWDNQVGPDAFVEGNGKVIFFGMVSQIISDETFNILEISTWDSWSGLEIEGVSVTCQHYDWTYGYLLVEDGGIFTANNLIDNGIYGDYNIASTGGTINISNYGTGRWVDLNGAITLNGGTMNVYGGDGPSYWPYASWGGITMTDGILDFHDQGIYIYDSPTYSLTENITGGTIRTAGGFWGETNEFTPEHGTLEFYGGTDAYIYTINTCHLNNVIINKLTKANSKISSKGNVLIDERSGKPLGDGSKSNTLSLIDFLDINGNLIIDNGTLNSSGYNIQIAGDWINNVGDPGFIEYTGWVTFDGANGADILTDETFANLMLNKTFSGIEGLELANGITISVLDDLSLDDGTMEMNNYSTINVDSNLFIANEAGLNANDGNNIIMVGGDWTNENTSYDTFQGFTPWGEVVIFDGTLDQILNTNAPQEDFSHIYIAKSSGNFRPNANIQAIVGMQILDGDWWDYVAGLTHYFHMNVHIYADGGYYPQGTTVFKGLSDGYFQNDGGVVQFFDVIVDKTSAKDNTLNNTKIPTSPKAMTVTLLSDMDVSNLTTIEEGTLYLNGHSLKSLAPVNINDGGELLMDTGASLSLGFSLSVNNGGLFTASGVSGNPANIGNIFTYKYDFEVNSGGNISANYANFSDMDMHGIEVKNGAFVDPANAFNNCNFYNGINSSFSALLIIENNQLLNINNINFYNNPNYSDAYNIFKSGNQGEVVITTTGGDFTGPLYEYDDYNRIHWTDYVHGLWTGNVSSDWFDPMNWSDYNLPGPASEVVIPSGTPNDPVINNAKAFCLNATIGAGASLEIGNNELIISDSISINGELIMTNSLAKLFSPDIYWHTGSSDNVTAGEFHVSMWYWKDGTNASLSVGNTAYISLYIDQGDADAAFGNLTIVVFTKGDQKSKGGYPVHIQGNCIIESGWTTDIDFIVDGDMEIQNGVGFALNNLGNLTCYSDFTLNGYLFINTVEEVFIHGMFNFGSTGDLYVNSGTFNCDYSLPTGWIDLFGDIQVATVGSLEFPDANISFAGTSTIIGGTIVAGRSINASLAGAFQPTGGTLELIGSASGHYIQIINGNYVNDLLVNRTTPIGIHPGSPLSVQGNMEINSEFKAQTNVLTVNGDVGINNGGILNIDQGAVLNLTDNKWLNVNNGGTIELIGLPGNEAFLSHSSGYYNFWIESGGIISAENAIFEYMRSEGVYIRSGAIIDPTHSFNGCVFQNGISNGQLLTVDNTQDFTVNNAVFPANTWGSNYNVYKNTTPGDVTFINATGDFTGEAYDYDPNNLVHWGMPQLTLDLTVFLEGPFNHSFNIMELDIHSIIPNDQPYNSNPLADWYYTGIEYVNPIPGFVVDWIVIDLRDATSAAGALPGTSIAKQAAFVLSTGEVVDLDGSNMLTFNTSITNDLYVAIWHRNHAGVMSAVPLIKSGGIYSYDFSSGGNQVHGGFPAHTQLSVSPLIWGMMAGDADGNGNIQLQDLNNVWNMQVGNTGYLESDFNLDAQSDNKDKNDFWLYNEGEGSQVPE